MVSLWNSFWAISSLIEPSLGFITWMDGSATASPVYLKSLIFSSLKLPDKTN